MQPAHGTESAGAPAARAPGAGSWPGVFRNEPRLVGENHGLHAISQAELGQHVRDVRLDRVLAEHEPGGDLGVREPLGDEAQDVELVARANRTGLQVALRVEGACADLDPAVAQIAFRVIQEGLTNALRYAASAPVSACIRGEGDALVIEVLNQRADRDVALAGTGAGNGLLGLSERVGARGGTVEAGPTSSGGWRLVA